MRTLSIIQREIPHYRVPLFSQLALRAKDRGLHLVVLSAEDGAGPSEGRFDHRRLPARSLGKGGGLWLEGLTDAVAGSDIIVAPQELHCLNVPYLWMRRHRLCRSWIWWGHGYNFQSADRPSLPLAIKESAKRFMTRRAEGLITYTESGARYWREKGLPAERVRPYYNTVDVESFRSAAADVGKDALDRTRAALKLAGRSVLLFSGRLYAEKRVDFLLRAFSQVQNRLPNTALLIVGDGPERKNLEALRDALKLDQVHFIGTCTDLKQVSLYFRLAELLVIPGLVGLAIVHGFAYGLPLVTTDYPGHSPEIEYLTPGSGVMTRQDITEYASKVVDLLGSFENLRSMQEAARRQGDLLRLSGSVERFLNAVIDFSGAARHQRERRSTAGRLPVEAGEAEMR